MSALAEGNGPGAAEGIGRGERILVRAPAWLGDFVAAEPSIRALYERVERAGCAHTLALAAPARFLELFDGRFGGLQRVPLGASDQAAPWREREVAVLLDGSWRSAWSAFRARVPVRAGFASGGRGPLLTHAVVPARERGETPLGIGRAGGWPRRLPRPFAASCAELFGLFGVSVSDPKPRLLASERSRASVEERLARAGLPRGAPFVLANAGSRPGSAKGFPPEPFAQALDELAPRAGLPVVVACAPGEEASARETASRCRVARAILLDEPAPDLPELVALSAAAKLAVGPDNGARHVAEALGTPCVVVYGPTDPRHTSQAPGHTSQRRATTRALRVEVPCGPCHRDLCPLSGELHHACMLRIDPSRVALAAAQLLG